MTSWPEPLPGPEFPYQGPPRSEWPPPAPALGTCYRHPDRQTGIVCTRCSRPICPECMIPAAVGFQCPECVRSGQASIRPLQRTTGLRSATRRWGAVTLSIIALNVGMFLVTVGDAALHGANPLNNQDSPIFVQLAQIPSYVDAGQWWRVITAGFLHFGVVHLAFNMWALLFFGSELERSLGWWRFLGIYVVSLLGGAAALQLFSRDVLAAGASTGIYGVFGALGVLLLYRRQDLRGLLQLLAINVLISLLPGFSIIGHLGGLVAGVLAATLVVITRRRPALTALTLVALGVVLLALAVAASTVLPASPIR